MRIANANHQMHYLAYQSSEKQLSQREIEIDHIYFTHRPVTMVNDSFIHVIPKKNMFAFLILDQNASFTAILDFPFFHHADCLMLL